MKRTFVVAAIVAFLAPAQAVAYRPWVGDSMLGMNLALADTTSQFDSASSDPVGCRQLHPHRRLVRCRYRLVWDGQGGGGGCTVVSYGRPGKWRFTKRWSDCPRWLLEPRGWQAVAD